MINPSVFLVLRQSKVSEVINENRTEIVSCFPSEQFAMFTLVNFVKVVQWQIYIEERILYSYALSMMIKCIHAELNVNIVVNVK